MEKSELKYLRPRRKHDEDLDAEESGHKVPNEDIKEDSSPIRKEQEEIKEEKKVELVKESMFKKIKGIMNKKKNKVDTNSKQVRIIDKEDESIPGESSGIYNKRKDSK